MIYAFILLQGVLLSMRILYFMDILRNADRKFYEIWRRKALYGVSAVLFGLAAAGFAAGDVSLLQLRRLDLGVTFLVLAVVDFRRRIVPDRMLLCYLAAQLLYSAVLNTLAEIAVAAASGLITSLVLCLLAWFSKEKIGWGDVKLLAVLAVTAGGGYVVQLAVFAMLPALVVGVILILVCRYSPGYEMPFVPFLFLGMLIQSMIKYL